MRLARTALLLTFAFALATAVGAQPRPGGGGGGPRPGPGGGGGGPPGGLIVQYDPDQIAKLLSDAGFPSQVIEMKDKSRQVQTQFWPDVFSGAIPIYCQNKNPGICNGVAIFANLGKSSVDSNWLNAWNASFFFVRAYTLESGELIFKYDVLLAPGVTPDYIKLTAAIFKNAVDQSTDFKP
jgi:hypothetical protein